jgi:SET domain-containing protein
MKLVRHKSPIHGEGIFSKEFIPKGASFYLVPLTEISHEPVIKSARINQDTWISDKEVLDFVNHSCDPNSKLDVSSDQPSLVALRDIHLNEEITCDYDLTEREGKKVTCTCGSINCKGYFYRAE